MTSVLILLLSLGALLEFFVSYCRAQLSSSLKLQLSAQVREVTGLHGPVAGREFSALVRLSRLCPGKRSRNGDVSAVCLYYRLLDMARSAALGLAPASIAWIDKERAGCAHFAAVILDRQISFSRAFIAEQLSSSI